MVTARKNLLYERRSKSKKIPNPNVQNPNKSQKKNVDIGNWGLSIVVFAYLL